MYIYKEIGLRSSNSTTPDNLITLDLTFTSYSPIYKLNLAEWKKWLAKKEIVTYDE